MGQAFLFWQISTQCPWLKILVMTSVFMYSMRANRHVTVAAVGALVFRRLKHTMMRRQMMAPLLTYNGITEHMCNIPQKSHHRAPVAICAIRLQ